jgi:hypothetical protein
MVEVVMVNMLWLYIWRVTKIKLWWVMVGGIWWCGFYLVTVAAAPKEGDGKEGKGR